MRGARGLNGNLIPCFCATAFESHLYRTRAHVRKYRITHMSTAHARSHSLCVRKMLQRLPDKRTHATNERNNTRTLSPVVCKPSIHDLRKVHAHDVNAFVRCARAMFASRVCVRSPSGNCCSETAPSRALVSDLHNARAAAPQCHHHAAERKIKYSARAQAWNDKWNR